MLWNDGRSTIQVRTWALRLSALCLSVYGAAQNAPKPLAGVGHAATLTFVQQDGSCMRGTIAKFDATSILVERFRQPPAAIQRDTLVPISQGNALLYSARSSWTDVSQTHPYPRESFVVKTTQGKRVRGMPIEVFQDSITLKRGFAKTAVAKSDVASVDYLRLRPATDGFNLALEEAPWALIFYSEFYGRAVGLEGLLPVRLYDASKPEDNRQSGVKVCYETSFTS